MSNARKQILLRISDSLYERIAAWAADDFRSVNGQIEYLLTECVKHRYRTRRLVQRRDHQEQTEADE